MSYRTFNNWKANFRDVTPLTTLEEMYLPDFRVPHERRDEIRAEFFKRLTEAGYAAEQIKQAPVVTLRSILAEVCAAIDLPREIIRLELQREYALVGAVIGSCGNLRMDY